MAKASKETEVIYKKHPDYPGYLFGSDGNIISKYKKTPMKFHVSKKGYFMVRIVRFDLKKHVVSVARMICRVWHGEPTDSKMQVNHKKGNKKDNRVAEIEWCTGQENMIHAYRILGIENHRKTDMLFPNCRIDRVHVKVIREAVKNPNFKLGVIAKYFGVCRKSIQNIKSNKTWRREPFQKRD